MKRSSTECRISLDGGVLIALALGEPEAERLKEEIQDGVAEAYCSELGMVEMTYILCRTLGWTEALTKKRHLTESGMIKIVETESLVEDVAETKCNRAISLPDCFTISLARRYRCKAVFARRERELEREIEKRTLDVELEFLASSQR